MNTAVQQAPRAIILDESLLTRTNPAKKVQDIPQTSAAYAVVEGKPVEERKVVGEFVSNGFHCTATIPKMDGEKRRRTMRHQLSLLKQVEGLPRKAAHAG